MVNVQLGPRGNMKDLFQELEDSLDNRTFASISQRISSGILWFINNLNLAHLAR